MDHWWILTRQGLSLLDSVPAYTLSILPYYYPSGTQYATDASERKRREAINKIGS